MVDKRQGVMDYLVRRFWLPLVILFVLVIAVTISNPIQKPLPIISCRAFFLNPDSRINIVDYLCDTAPRPDFAHNVIYDCPVSGVLWSDDDSSSIEVELKQCRVVLVNTH